VKAGDLEDGPEAGLLDGGELYAAYDQLVGAGRWRPFGKAPDVRIGFPAEGHPSDWHVDVADSEGGDPLDPYSWRVSLASKAFALLVFALLSDVPEPGRATILRKRSHRSLARRLAGLGPKGMVLRDLMQGGFRKAPKRLGRAYGARPGRCSCATPSWSTPPRPIAPPRPGSCQSARWKPSSP
jgi:hypothetical protein